MTRNPDAGFTLIETLVALAVLAVSSIAFLGATEAHVVRIGGLEYRAAAQLAAQNFLAEATLGLEPRGSEVLLGIAFEIIAEEFATDEPRLRRLNILVSDASDGKVYGRLIGFVQSADWGAP